MDKRICLKNERLGQGMFKTLFLFLSHHKFIKTADMLREEWSYGQTDLEELPGTSLLLIRCECSRSPTVQAEAQNTATSSQKNDWLEGTYQGEDFRLKGDNAHIFYVCEHSNKENKQAARGCKMDRQLDSDTVSPRYDPKQLKSKFSQLQDEHHKLIEVTSELTTALQINIISQTRNISSVLEHCKTIYPGLFHESRHSISSPENYFRSRSRSQSPEYNNKSENENKSESQNATSDVNKDAEAERKIEIFHEDVTEGGSTKHRIARTPESPQSQLQCETQQNDGLNLDLEQLRWSPSLNSPLTPETVRCVLESVFERIFDIEKAKEKAARNSKGRPLNKSDVEMIVGDVLNEVINSSMRTSPCTCGARETKFTKRSSPTTRVKSDLIHKDNEKTAQWPLRRESAPHENHDDEEVDLLEAKLGQDDFIHSEDALLLKHLADEKSQIFLSSYGLKQDPPSSISLFSDEFKQFKTFEAANPKRFAPGTQNAIKRNGRITTFNRYSGGCIRYPVAPLCYMENCQKLQNGNTAQCSCSKCVPGQSRYSCGCYDAIRKDISQNGDNLKDVNFGNAESNISKPVGGTTTNADRHSAAEESHVEIERLDSINNNGGPIVTDKEDGRTGSGCKVCGEKRCECAFDPRPKLCRTPTL